MVQKLSFFFNFWLSIWITISFHPYLYKRCGSIYFTHTCLHILQLRRLTFSCQGIIQYHKKNSVSTYALSSKYKHKNTVWPEVNVAEEVCMNLFLTQVYCIHFHSLLFSYRSEIVSTYLLFRRSLQVKIQSDAISRPSVRLPETTCQRYNILWIFLNP